MLIAITICLAIIIVLLEHKAHLKRLNKLKQDHAAEIKKARVDAISRSKNVIRGQITEEIIPILPGFTYNLSDMKFLANPVDYIIFDGMSTFRDSKDSEITIVFADVKTGGAGLTPVQQMIKKAIEDGRVRFEKWVVSSDNTFKIR